jgi:hypothetical protein
MRTGGRVTYDTGPAGLGPDLLVVLLAVPRERVVAALKRAEPGERAVVLEVLLEARAALERAAGELG